LWPNVPLPFLTSASTTAASSPAFATIWRSGSSIERDRILMPMAWSSLENPGV